MIYWFETAYNIDIKQLNKDLVSHGFDGAMFPYQVFRHDYFTRISNSIDNKITKPKLESSCCVKTVV